MKVPYSKGRGDAKMTNAGDFQPSGTTDSATEREGEGERERNWPPNPADFLRIKGLLIVTRSLDRSLEFVAISLQFEVLSRTERLLLDLRKGNRNYRQASEMIS